MTSTVFRGTENTSCLQRFQASISGNWRGDNRLKTPLRPTDCPWRPTEWHLAPPGGPVPFPVFLTQFSSVTQ